MKYNDFNADRLGDSAQIVSAFLFNKNFYQIKMHCVKGITDISLGEKPSHYYILIFSALIVLMEKKFFITRIWWKWKNYSIATWTNSE